jgi:hypothetical protein
VLDHSKATPREVISLQAGGVELPAFPIPGLPYRVVPGRGTSQLRLTIDGDRLDAQWAVASGRVAWQGDSATTRRLNAIESLVAQVLTGIPTLQMNARMYGPIGAPRLAVSSNLDRVVADRLRSLVGAQVAAAEAKLRARVDTLVDEKAAPVKARIAELRTEADQRIADARGQLDAEKQKLDARIKELSGGLVGLP